VAQRLRDASIELYEAGRERARQNGIIIADTKFEFGRSPGGELVLIDELLTPDSSRFWPADRYELGRGQPSFDKQPLRDYLDELRQNGEWNGEAPPPTLPAEVVSATSRRYQDAYHRITGEPLPDAL
jgi:phosphoribosylaminoimidazole-succinocarboxamide synthase